MRSDLARLARPTARRRRGRMGKYGYTRLRPLHAESLEARLVLNGDPIALGSLVGLQRLEDFVGSSDTEDLYSFSLATAETVALDLSATDDPVDFRLALDANGNQMIDFGETVLSFDNVDRSPTAATRSLAAGQYLAEVSVDDTTRNSRFTLVLNADPPTPQPLGTDPGESVATAHDLGELTAAVTLADSLASGSDPSDHYRFTLANDQAVSFRLSGVTESIELEVLADLNGNGSLSSSEVLASGVATSTVDKLYTTDLPSGEYFVRVSPNSGSATTDYALQIEPVEVLPSSAPSDPGESPSQAWNIGTLDSPRLITEAVGGHDTSDFYEFTIEQNARVRVLLGSNINTLDFDLVVDSNGNDSISSSEDYHTATIEVGGDLWFEQDLTPGSYLVRVYPYNNAANSRYRLELSASDLPSDPLGDPGNTVNSARDLGELASVWSTQEVVSGRDINDYYRFTVDSNTRVRLDAWAKSETVRFMLVADFDQNGSISNQEILREFDLGGDTRSWFEQDLTAGTYYVSAIRYINNNHSSAYDLELTRSPLPADPLGDPGNSVNTAREIGELPDEWSTEEVVSGHDVSDYYRFTVNENTRVRLTALAESELITVALVADFDQNGSITNPEILSDFDLSGGAESWQEQDLTPGTYYVQVSRYFNGGYNSAYRLELSRSALPFDLLGDPGNTLETARNIGELTDTWSIEEVVSGHDVLDFYQFTVDHNSRVRLTATAQSEQTTFALAADFDGNGSIQNSEILSDFNPSGGVQSWLEEDLTAGTYYVWAERYFNNEYNSAYALELSRSELPSDPLGDPGNSIDTAQDLGELGPSWSTAEVVSGHDVTDYYRFTVDRNSRIHVKGFAESERVSFALAADFDANGSISSSEILRDFDLVEGSRSWFEQDLTAGTYYVSASRYFNNEYNSAYELELLRSDLPGDPLGDPGESLATARNIGTLTDPWSIEEVVSGSDLHDYYRFTINDTSQVRLSTFAESEIVVFALAADLDANGTISGSEVIRDFNLSGGSRSWIEEELSPGTYYASASRFVNGQYNSAYRLKLQVLDSPLMPPDPGSSLATAWNNGTLEEDQSFQGTVSPGDDRDLYRFNLGQPGSIHVRLDQLEDDADVFLIVDLNENGIWDDDESIDFHSTSGTGNRSFTEVLDEGEFFLAVLQGSDPITTSYRLSVFMTPIELDPVVDPGGNFGSAYDLGTLTSGVDVVSQQVIGETDSHDLYRFELSEPSRVSIWQTHASEHVSILLGTDLDNDGAWDSGETLESDTNFATTHSMFEDLTAGIYYVSVRQFTPNEDNTAYRLTVRADTIETDPVIDPGGSFATAYNLGIVPPESDVIARQLIGASDSHDLYRFEIFVPSRVRIRQTHANEHTQIYLGADLDGDGSWDSNETLESDTGFSTSHSLVEDLLPGEYFISVTQYSPDDDNTAYRLTVRTEALQTNPSVDPGGGFLTAYDLGVLSADTEIVQQQLVGAEDSHDVYRLELTQPTRLRVYQTHASEQTALYLMSDLNNNGELDSGETLESSTGFSTSKSLSEDLEPGVYFVSVRRYDDEEYNTAYRLTLRTESLVTDPEADPGETFATAYDLGPLAPGAETTSEQLVGSADFQDLYRFEVTDPSRVWFWQSHATEQTGLYLFSDLNGDGVGETLDSDSGFNTSQSFFEELAPGVYYVQVRQYSSSGDYNTAYRLTLRTEAIDLDPTIDPGEELATAHNLGLLDSDQRLRQTVGNGDLDDYYAFTLDRIQEVQANLYGLSEDADLQLYADLNGNGSIESGEALATSRTSGSNPEYLREELAPGTYFIHVNSTATQNNTAYTLELDVTPVVFDSPAPGPAIASIVPLGSPVIDTIEVAFTSAIAAASFTAADVTFSGPAGNVTLSTIEMIDSQTYRLHFDDPTASGVYTLGIGPEITDASGNPMNQDGDRFAGESIDDRYQSQVLIVATDLAVEEISTLEATTQFGSSITVRYEVRNAGLISLATPWLDRVWLSADSTLDPSDMLLGEFSSNDSLPFAAGASYLQTETLDLPLETSLPADDYYLIVRTDATGVQAELSEANNLQVSNSFSVSHPPLPDLTVSSIDLPQEAFAGQQLLLSWTLTNNGEADLGEPFVDRLYLSLDDSRGNDIYLAEFEYESALPPGESVTRTQLVTLPSSYLGQFHLLVVTDVYNEIYERLGETNNLLASAGTIEISQPPSPDLQVVSVTAPQEAFSEQELVVSWVVENRGDAPTNSPIWYDRVYLSDDPQFNPLDDQLLATVANTSYLDVNQQYVNQAAVTLPRGLDGDYYFVVVTDATSRVTELDQEGNNAGAGNPTDITLTPPPDLVVSSVVSPALGLSGQEFVAQWTVTNAGPGETRVDQWTDTVYLSTDTQYDAADQRLGRVQHEGALDLGESYTTERSLVLPIESSGPYYVIVVTDSGDIVYEHDQESNNASVNPPQISVTPVRADLEVTSVEAQPQARAGTATTVSWQVENRGLGITPASSWADRVYLSTDADFNALQDTLLVTRYHHGPLAPDQAYNASASVVLPHTLDGEYHVFVTTDAFNNVLELDITNNNREADDLLQIDALPADLVSQIDDAPEATAAGSPFLFSWSVTNQGLGDTIRSSWTDSVILSVDDTYGNADDRLLMRRTHEGLLQAAGVAAVCNHVVQMPFDVVPGAYHLFVVADSSDRVYEAVGEGNNASAPLALTVNRATANLQVSQVDIPNQADSGQFIDVTWTVDNVGPVASEALFWHDSIYLSPDPTPGGGDFHLRSVQRNNVLAAGDSYSRTVSVRIPSNLAGDYYLYVVTDNHNRVLEDPSESDNLLLAPSPLAVTFVDTPPPPNPGPQPGPDPIFPPELEVLSVAAPATALSGQTIEVSWQVRNNSYSTEYWTWTDAVYLSTDQVLDSRHDLALGYVHRPQDDLLTGQQYLQTADFRIPAGVSGPFYVYVRTDASRRIAEADEFNNDGYQAQSIAVSLTPPADLVVGTITVPATGVPGQTASISYRVDNLGAQPAIGSWTDTLFLSADAQWDVDDQQIGSVQHTGGLAVGDFYLETLQAPLPGVLPGEYHVIVRSDIRDYIPETNQANNFRGSLERVVLDLESLTLGVASSGTLAEDQSTYYQVDVPEGETLQFTFDSSSSTAANELYVRFGDMPSRTEYDFAFDDAFQPDQQILVPRTQAGTYYILAYGDAVEEASATYTIQADILDFSIKSIDVTRGSRFGSTTFTVSGAKLTPSTEVQLVGPSGEVHTADRVWWINEATLWATLDLQGLPVEQYDVQVVDGLEQDALEDAFQVTSGPLGSFAATIETPSLLLPGQSGFATLRYRNLGETDIVAPLLLVDATNANLVSQGELAPVDNVVTLLAINPDSPAGILPPGAEHTIQIPFRPTIDLGTVEIRALDLGESDTLIQWNAMEESLRPAGVADEAWQVIWDQYLQAVGADVGSLHDNLAENATYLSQLGIYTTSVARLIGFELAQANNALPSLPLAQSTDASATVPGLPLEFRRAVHQSFSERYALRALGRGWTHNWDYQTTTDATGNVVIRANGSVRNFALQADGSYQELAGDQAVLTLESGAYHLREADGLEFGFLASGQLSFLSDSNGDRIDAGYTDGRLTSLTHTSGAEFLLQYNASGQIEQLTDDLGQITTYQYDASGQYLEHVITPSGTTDYTYHTSGTATQLHAIRSISAPEGDTLDFTYEAEGRLAEQLLNDSSPPTSYTYGDIALVSTTDPAGATTHRYYDDAGALRQVRDPLGEITRLQSNASGSPVVVELPNSFTAIAQVLDIAYTQIVAAFDPNEIIGPTGVGEERWVSALEPLNYTVRFDNDPLLASAPARRVAITVPLDADLDPRSVRLDDFGFGELIVELPGDRGFYAKRLDLRDSLGVLVDVIAGVNFIAGDIRTGEVFWEMTAIDPQTGQPPLDPLVGFLPVNLDGSQGQGFTQFSVRARETASSGVLINADAQIVFDTNPPVATPPTFNTVDAATPISSVTETSDGPAPGVYQVSWTGTDEPQGAGLQGFDIYMSQNDEPFELWMADTTLRTSLFVAEPANSYAFYTVAADRTGNREQIPLVADATIGLQNGVVGRRLFYHNSVLGDAGEAIATDKSPLLPGETATFANYSSYRGGITGIMIDIDGLAADATLDPATDFEFRVGNDDDPANWSLLGIDPQLTIDHGAGALGSDRIVLTWPDATARGQWLQIRLRANAVTSLAADDVFYFGNAPGESGDSPDHALVNGTDFLGVRGNHASFLNPAGSDNRFDFNRDQRVNATDLAIVRQYTTSMDSALRIITVPFAVAPATLTKGPVSESFLVHETKLPSEGEPQAVRTQRHADDVCKPIAVDRLLAELGNAFMFEEPTILPLPDESNPIAEADDDQLLLDSAFEQLLTEFDQELVESGSE